MSRYRRPQTIELDTERFSATCRELAQQTVGFGPDLVVGIATGGKVVAEAMIEALSPAPQITIVSLSRPTTALKHKFRVGSILGRLPPPVTNMLRWLEVEAREFFLRSKSSSDELSPSVSPDFDDLISAAHKVLIVDDMVDSGRTLAATMQLVRRRSSDAEIRTAVIASSWRKPPVIPDICLYHRTLVRFPWSLDAGKT